MDIVVRLRPDAAQAIRSGRDLPSAARDVRAAVGRLGAVLQPQHPPVSDPELERYFVIADVPPRNADRVAAELGELEAVESAYVQPRPAPA